MPASRCAPRIACVWRTAVPRPLRRPRSRPRRGVQAHRRPSPCAACRTRDENTSEVVRTRPLLIDQTNGVVVLVEHLEEIRGAIASEGDPPGRAEIEVAEQGLDRHGVRHRVRRVRQDDRRLREPLEEIPQRIGDRVLVAERRVPLRKLLRLGVMHDLLVSPVDAETFEEVVPLDVAIVVPRRRVGRIETHEVKRWLDVEHIGLNGPALRAAVEHHRVVLRHGLDEVFTEGEA